MTSFYVTIKRDDVFARGPANLARIYEKLVNVVTRTSLDVQRDVKEMKLSGQVLRARTGTLRRSINREVKASPQRIYAIVGTNVEYAAYQEFGAHIPEVTGKLMVFPRPGLSPKFLTATGRIKSKFRGDRDLVVFTMRHRAFDLPARSFLRSALTEWQPEIKKRIEEAVMEALSK